MADLVKMMGKLDRLSGGEMPKASGLELIAYIETSFKDLSDDEIWEGCQIALDQPYKLTGQSVIQGLEKVRTRLCAERERKAERSKQEALQDKIESTPREAPDPDLMKTFYEDMERKTERFRDLGDDYVDQPKTGYEWRDKD